MSEAELRDGLRAAIGDEPPLDFDADALIRRAQDARRRRRALVAVAVATLVLTGTVLSLPGVLDRRPGVDAAEGPVLTTTVSESTTPSPPSPSSVAPPEPTRAATTVPPEATTLLSGYLSRRFAEVVPDTKVVTVELNEVRGIEPVLVTGVVHFVDPVGPGAVALRLGTSPAHDLVGESCGEVDCDGPPLPLADGSYVTTGTTTAPESELVSRTVTHFRRDGSVVQVTGYNYDPASIGRWRAEVAPTVDQLVLLATDPKLAIR